MKTLVYSIITILGLSAQASLCENIQDTSGLKKLTLSGEIRKLATINPALQLPATYELGMIQAVVSEVNPDLPMTPSEALDVFVDAEHGVFGGAITYLSAPGSSDILALVTYFPGENEYGAIFKLSKIAERWFVTKVAVVDDSEIFDCRI